MDIQPHRKAGNPSEPIQAVQGKLLHNTPTEAESEESYHQREE